MAKRITRKKIKSRRRKQKQKGGSCIELNDRREAIYDLKKVLETPENIKGFYDTPRKDDQDYSVLKYTIIPAGAKFLSRSANNLLENLTPPIQSNHGRWADYTVTLGLPSYLLWPAPSELAPFTQKLIHIYGPWLNTYETTRDIKVLHFPFNDEDPHNKDSFGPYCEDQIKINVCKYAWYMEQNPNPSCVDAYTMSFLPGSDVDRSPKSKAPSEYREIALRDPTSFQLISSEYAPLPDTVPPLTVDQKKAIRNVKDKDIRMQNDYREIYGKYLLEIQSGEKSGKYARNKVIKK